MDPEVGGGRIKLNDFYTYREEMRGRGRGWEDEKSIFSEWIPVRQKKNQRGGFQTGFRPRKFSGEFLEKVEPLEEGCFVQSFMFRNFPPTLHEKELISVFQKAGKVVDLFCPKKKDVLGRRFGFVRMKLGGEEEGEAMLEKLNSVWIDSYKIRAFIPQFERRKPKTIPPSMVRANFTEKGRSFVNVVAGKSLVLRENIVGTSKVNFIPTEEETKWLEGAYVGLLKQEFRWEEDGDEIQRGVDSVLNIKQLGESLILILQKEVQTETKENTTSWEQRWFSWIRPWKPEDIAIYRSVWTIWYGVPMHAWSERFFKQICLHFGVFLEWDESSK